MIDSLLLKETDNTNIIWIPSNNMRFEKFFAKLNYFYFNINDMFLGNCTPNIVITNNRFSQLDNIVNICNKYLINLIIIDHEEKSDVINLDRFMAKIKKIPNVLQVAINNQVYNSWNKKHDVIIENYEQNPEDIKLLINTFAHKTYIK